VLDLTQTLCFLATPHEMQRPKTCERFESARPLKTGSQPIGGRDSVVTTVDETVEVCLGATCKRSPLWLRSPMAAESPATARPPTRLIMAILLAARRLTRNEIKSVLFASICDTPQWGTRIVSTLSCTALRLLFRPLIIVNASQIAAGCRLQHSRSLSVSAAARSFAPLWANGNGMKRLRLPRRPPTSARSQPAVQSALDARREAGILMHVHLILRESRKPRNSSYLGQEAHS
jgi:hypothetical protein